MRSEEETNRAIELYSDMIQHLCIIHLKNHADTEDIFQTVFLKYLTCGVMFENESHEKAWFIRVTINACKDLLKSIKMLYIFTFMKAIQLLKSEIFSGKM